VRISCMILLIAMVPVVMGTDDIELSVGPMVSNLVPMDASYGERFLTPGTSTGISVDVDAPGPLAFRITGEYFWKHSSPTGWDGSVDAWLVSVMPMVERRLLGQLSVFAGAGGTYVSGNYSGTDDFGEFVEVSGSSAGFVAGLGVQVKLAGPLSGRLEYRRSFVGFKTDNAVVDGRESTIYPPTEIDLGSSQFCMTFPVSIFGGGDSVF